MMTRHHPRRRAGPRLRSLAAAAFVAGAVAWSGSARADHSINRPCLDCHSLRSTAVQEGTRNILKDLVTGAAGLFYTASYWYCGADFSASDSRPDALDCSYCHDKDVAKYIFDSGLGAKGSSHPVDVRGTEGAYSANFYDSGRRILCNDCHGVEVTPVDPCDKSAGSAGYPNHVITPTAASVGNKLRPGHLVAGYTYDVNSGWFGTAASSLDGMLCFKCHTSNGFSANKAGESVTVTVSNVKTEYMRPGGGHNLAGVGSLTALKDRNNANVTGAAAPKLPCYDCHDPHASTSVGTGASDNKSLVLNDYILVGGSYTNYQKTTDLTTYVDFTGGNDRAVCYGCHNKVGKSNARFTVEGINPPDIVDVAPKFPFHANVHAGVGGTTGTGNCLQKNGGCHQSPHNTDIFRCLDCHSKATTDAIAAAGKTVPARLLATNQVDSEFGHIGAISGNGIKSSHTVVYDTTKDMSDAANNGCLGCHDTRGDAAGSVVKGPGDTAKAKFTGTAREALNHFDSFCLSCHDGAGTSFGALVPPNVGDYFLLDGHGLRSGTYDSGNPAGKIPCLECHLYHGSTAYKLLPGDAQTADGVGNVVKREGGPTAGTKFTIGQLTSSEKIDYTDYTVDTYGDYSLGTKKANEGLPSNFPYRAWFVSEYTTLWTTYSDDTNLAPKSGVATTPFGTSGALRNYNSDNYELDCGKDASASGIGTKKIGFCNACHFYNNSTDGTTTTYGKNYSHEGKVPGTTCTGKDLKSEKNFFKDCSECHDPHGSGKKGGASPNLYMIRGKIKVGATSSLSDVTSDGNWGKVVFTAKTGPNSYDANDGDNSDDLCAVCHVYSGVSPDTTGANVPNVQHNYRAQTVPSHQEGNNCMVCHNHSSGLVSDPLAQKNIAAVAFGLASTCTGCHGLPPISPCDTPTDPVNELSENYAGGGGAHKRHVDFIKTKLGQTTYTNDWCIPCHGASPGGATWHLDSGTPPDLNWAGENRNTAVDIVDGSGNFGSLARYNGASVPSVGPGAKGGEPQVCANLNCHGPGATTGKQLLWDQTCPGGSASASARSEACAGCHASRGSTAGQPLTSIVVGSYTSQLLSQGVTANYYRTVSGYGRGGHGDAAVQNEDPFVNSDPSHATPLLCDACHDDTAMHFPGTPAERTAMGSNAHRLDGYSRDGIPYSTEALCNSCHPVGNYPGSGSSRTHHPSYRGQTGATPSDHAIVMPAGWSSQPVMTPVGSSTNWAEVGAGSAHYEQTAYGAGNASAPWQYPGNPDKGIDWWAGSPGTARTPQPRPVFYGETQSASPKAILPLGLYIGNQVSDDRVMCVTCHNPHGTDLYVHDTLGGLTSIPDNNMLRLRDEDNTLCNACH